MSSTRPNTNMGLRGRNPELGPERDANGRLVSRKKRPKEDPSGHKTNVSSGRLASATKGKRKPATPARFTPSGAPKDVVLTSAVQSKRMGKMTKSQTIDGVSSGQVSPPLPRSPSPSSTAAQRVIKEKGRLPTAPPEIHAKDVRLAGELAASTAQRSTLHSPMPERPKTVAGGKMQVWGEPPSRPQALSGKEVQELETAVGDNKDIEKAAAMQDAEKYGEDEAKKEENFEKSKAFREKPSTSFADKYITPAAVLEKEKRPVTAEQAPEEKEDQSSEEVEETESGDDTEKEESSNYFKKNIKELELIGGELNKLQKRLVDIAERYNSTTHLSRPGWMTGEAEDDDGLAEIRDRVSELMSAASELEDSEVLQSMQQLFKDVARGEVPDDAELPEELQEVAEKSPEQVKEILELIQKAKTRLKCVHGDILDFYQEQKKEMVQKVYDNSSPTQKALLEALNALSQADADKGKLKEEIEQLQTEYTNAKESWTNMANDQHSENEELLRMLEKEKDAGMVTQEKLEHERLNWQDKEKHLLEKIGTLEESLRFYDFKEDEEREKEAERKREDSLAEIQWKKAAEDLKVEKMRNLAHIGKLEQKVRMLEQQQSQLNEKLAEVKARAHSERVERMLIQTDRDEESKLHEAEMKEQKATHDDEIQQMMRERDELVNENLDEIERLKTEFESQIVEERQSAAAQAVANATPEIEATYHTEMSRVKAYAQRTSEQMEELKIEMEEREANMQKMSGRWLVRAEAQHKKQLQDIVDTLKSKFGSQFKAPLELNDGNDVCDAIEAIVLKSATERVADTLSEADSMSQKTDSRPPTATERDKPKDPAREKARASIEKEIEERLRKEFELKHKKAMARQKKDEDKNTAEPKGITETQEKNIHDENTTHEQDAEEKDSNASKDVDTVDQKPPTSPSQPEQDHSKKVAKESVWDGGVCRYCHQKKGLGAKLSEMEGKMNKMIQNGKEVERPRTKQEQRLKTGDTAPEVEDGMSEEDQIAMKMAIEAAKLDGASPATQGGKSADKPVVTKQSLPKPSSKGFPKSKSGSTPHKPAAAHPDAPHPTEQPLKHSTQQPGQDPTHPTQQDTQHPIQQAAQHPGQQTTQHPTQQTAQQDTQHPTQQTTQHPAQQTTQYPIQQVAQHLPTDQPTQQHPASTQPKVIGHDVPQRESDVIPTRPSQLPKSASKPQRVETAPPSMSGGHVVHGDFEPSQESDELLEHEVPQDMEEPEYMTFNEEVPASYDQLSSYPKKKFQVKTQKVDVSSVKSSGYGSTPTRKPPRATPVKHDPVTGQPVVSVRVPQVDPSGVVPPPESWTRDGVGQMPDQGPPPGDEISRQAWEERGKEEYGQRLRIMYDNLRQNISEEQQKQFDALESSHALEKRKLQGVLQQMQKLAGNVAEAAANLHRSAVGCKRRAFMIHGRGVKEPDSRSKHPFSTDVIDPSKLLHPRSLLALLNFDRDMIQQILKIIQVAAESLGDTDANVARELDELVSKEDLSNSEFNRHLDNHRKSGATMDLSGEDSSLKPYANLPRSRSKEIQREREKGRLNLVQPIWGASVEEIDRMLETGEIPEVPARKKLLAQGDHLQGGFWSYKLKGDRPQSPPVPGGNLDPEKFPGWSWIELPDVDIPEAGTLKKVEGKRYQLSPRSDFMDRPTSVPRPTTASSTRSSARDSEEFGVQESTRPVSASAARQDPDLTHMLSAKESKKLTGKLVGRTTEAMAGQKLKKGTAFGHVSDEPEGLDSVGLSGTKL